MTPLLNAAVSALPERKVSIVATCSLVAATAIGTLDASSDPFGMAAGYSFVWLAYLYFLGACMRRRIAGEGPSRWVLIGTFAACLVITVGAKVAFHGSGLALHEVQLEDLLVSYCSPTVLLMGIALLLVCLRVRRPADGAGARLLRRVGAATYCMYIANVNPTLWAWCRDRFAFLSGLEPAGLVAGALAVTAVEVVVAMALGLAIDAIFDWLGVKSHLDAVEVAVRRRLG